MIQDLAQCFDGFFREEDHALTSAFGHISQGLVVITGIGQMKLTSDENAQCLSCEHEEGINCFTTIPNLLLESTQILLGA